MIHLHEKTNQDKAWFYTELQSDSYLRSLSKPEQLVFIYRVLEVALKGLSDAIASRNESELQLSSDISIHLISECLGPALDWRADQEMSARMSSVYSRWSLEIVKARHSRSERLCTAVLNEVIEFRTVFESAISPSGGA